MKEGVTTDNLLVSRPGSCLSYLIILSWIACRKRPKVTISGTTIKELDLLIWIRLRVLVSRIADLLDRAFSGTLGYQFSWKNRLFERLYSTAINFDDILKKYYEYRQQIKQYVADTSVILNDTGSRQADILKELKVMLDIDQGTYHCLTSSSCCWRCNDRFWCGVLARLTKW